MCHIYQWQSQQNRKNGMRRYDIHVIGVISPPTPSVKYIGWKCDCFSMNTELSRIVTMRPQRSQKHPPIVAYLQDTVKKYSDYTSNSKCKTNSDEFPVKASVEMNSAIRRQKRTTGVDYWNPPSATLCQTGHGKRATSEHAFFPALGMRRTIMGKGEGKHSAQSNGTVLKQGLSEFNRAHSTSDMAPPPGFRSNTEHIQQHRQVRNGVVVTDMACLDSGEPEKSSQLEYFYQLYRAKFRYTDHIQQHCVERNVENDMSPKQTNGCEEETAHIHVSHPRKPVKVYHSMRNLSIPSFGARKRGSLDVKVSSGNGTVKDGRRHGAGVLLEVADRTQPDRHLISDSVDPQALRPTANKDLTITGTVYALNQSSSRSHTSRSNSCHIIPVGGIPREHSNGQFHREFSAKLRAVRSASIPRVHLSRKAPSENGSRKRTVHFSRSNEVYEYKPSDPVKY